MVESHVPSEEEKAAVLQAQRQAREEAMVSHNYVFTQNECMIFFRLLHYVYSSFFYTDQP